MRFGPGFGTLGGRAVAPPRDDAGAHERDMFAQSVEFVRESEWVLRSTACSSISPSRSRTSRAPTAGRFLHVAQET